MPSCRSATEKTFGHKPAPLSSIVHTAPLVCKLQALSIVSTGSAADSLSVHLRQIQANASDFFDNSGKKQDSIQHRLLVQQDSLSLLAFLLKHTQPGACTHKLQIYWIRTGEHTASNQQR